MPDTQADMVVGWKKAEISLGMSIAELSWAISSEGKGLTNKRAGGALRGMFFPSKMLLSSPSAPPLSLSLKSAAKISILEKQSCASLSLLPNANSPEALTNEAVLCILWDEFIKLSSPKQIVKGNGLDRKREVWVSDGMGGTCLEPKALPREGKGGNPTANDSVSQALS